MKEYIKNMILFKLLSGTHKISRLWYCNSPTPPSLIPQLHSCSPYNPLGKYWKLKAGGCLCAGGKRSAGGMEGDNLVKRNCKTGY